MNCQQVREEFFNPAGSAMVDEHVRACAACAEQLASLPMRPRGRVWLSALGIVIVLLSLLGTWFYSHLIVFSGVVYLVVLTLFYLAMKKSRRNITMSSS